MYTLGHKSKWRARARGINETTGKGKRIVFLDIFHTKSKLISQEMQSQTHKVIISHTHFHFSICLQVETELWLMKYRYRWWCLCMVPEWIYLLSAHQLTLTYWRNFIWGMEGTSHKPMSKRINGEKKKKNLITQAQTTWKLEPFCTSVS